jgi:hypothetical protein
MQCRWISGDQNKAKWPWWSCISGHPVEMEWRRHENALAKTSPSLSYCSCKILSSSLFTLVVATSPLELQLAGRNLTQFLLLSIHTYTSLVISTQLFDPTPKSPFVNTITTFTNTSKSPPSITKEEAQLTSSNSHFCFADVGENL